MKRLANALLSTALLSPSLAVSAASGVTHSTPPSACGEGKLRVLLIAPAWPWGFGAYQSQLSTLGAALVDLGHAVVWNAAFRPGVLPDPDRVYTFSEASLLAAGGDGRLPTESAPSAATDARSSRFGFIDVPLPEAYWGRGNGVLVSAVDAAARRHAIDAVVLLLDANLASRHISPCLLVSPSLHLLPSLPISPLSPSRQCRGYLVGRANVSWLRRAVNRC